MLEVITFGCRLNALESEVMKARASAAGLGDAVLVNTCAVTAESVRQAKQAIRKAKREQPDRSVVVSGCAAQIDAAEFAAMPEVDLVLGNAEKLGVDAYQMAADPAARVRVSDIMARRETAGHFADRMEGRARAFLQIQNGCDHRCTFCIIPYGRGPSRSVPAAEVIQQARALVEAGHAEIVLTGVDITAYGHDLAGAPQLGGLVRRILTEVPELPRLRLSSIDSVEADAELLRAVAEEERLMPHFHLSLQSGDDLILKRMKRRHLRADAIAFAQTVRRLRPEVALGADLIAGFPTETEAMFANSLALIDECGLTQLHVFPFSPRPGTPAARMPQLDRALIKERAGRLRARGQAALAGRLQREIGQRRTILVERAGLGNTEHFFPVRLTGSDATGIVPALIAGQADNMLVATPAPKAA